MSKLATKLTADDVLNTIGAYLECNGWVVDSHGLLWVDPVTAVRFTAFTALDIQFSREVQKVKQR